MMYRHAGPVVCALLLAFSAVAADSTVKFNRDIRPIMSDTCFRCHGPDAKARIAGLRLDIREEALKTTKSGITPIVPGQPDKSAIIQRIFSASPAKIMPPVAAHKELTQPQKDKIRKWVEQGAAYEVHWAYEPIKRPSPPQLADASLVRNPIDVFIQDRLHRENLTPSKEADRRTLIRRVTLDLTGVPPSIAEVEAFVNDQSSDAYEKVVDRLLASPRYAEMQTMRWLDAVRYADTSGFHGDNPWPAWPYRDYVLRSFQQNKPFDQFTREQLAGDLLPSATTETHVASAFNRLNRASAEGGLQPKEYLAKYGADRVRTISTVWLGATVGCAECHDHKFDPYLSKDFYSMKAFFADVKETGLVPDRGAKAWGAKLTLPTPEQKERLAALDDHIKTQKVALDKLATKLQERRWIWEEQLPARHKKGELEWKYQQPISAESQNGATLTIHKDELFEANFYLAGSVYSEKKKSPGLVVASGANPDNDTYTVTLKPGSGTWTAIGIEVQQDESLPGNRVARGADRFVVTEVEGSASSNKLEFVLANSIELGEPLEHTAMAAIDGKPETGWGVGIGEQRNPFLALRLKEKLTTSADSVVTLRIRQDSVFRRATLGRFRLALSSAEFSAPETGDSNAKFKAADKNGDLSTLAIATDRGVPPAVLKAIETDEVDRTEEQQEQVVKFFLWSQPDLQKDIIQLAHSESDRVLLLASIPSIITTERTRPRTTRVLPRGNFLDESGAIVTPAIPVVFGTLKVEDRPVTRLDLANWLVSSDNPLTPRVFANRTWRQYFGTGLSKILEDLGSQGELPTHPELLDWLAAEFISSKWDTKQVVRTIVTSHTYRQSSMSNPALEEKDPYNRLLARQSRFRVDAEVVHDTALSIADLLTEKVGGPSVKPYQPEGYYATLNFPKREYSESRGPDMYRRALYTHWQRTFLHPSLLAFDAPTREECTVNRTSSNTPLQALVMLNDPIFVEAAQSFAKHIIENGKDLNSRLDWAYQKALDRSPDKEERKILSDLYKKYTKDHKGDDLGGMTTVARAILNLHETITRN